MSIVSNFFDIFRHKDVNKVTGAENNTAEDNVAPLVVQANQNATSMVRADNFTDSSVEPEEYTVREDEEEEEEFLEDADEGKGIVVEDGDDMSPIIMDEHEEIVIGAEEIEKMIEPSHKNEVIEYTINIRPEEPKDDDDVEIL
ncbi:MAG: hypothetical protein J6C28_00860 [Bacilli bacterium]|nr:hypothetical protein [Bacilli bacterium]